MLTTVALSGLAFADSGLHTGDPLQSELVPIVGVILSDYGNSHRTYRMRLVSTGVSAAITMNKTACP